MRLATFLLGLFFLITPEVSTFDILPDFIGCILMLRGLGKLSDISGSAEEAVKCIRRIITLSAVKTLLFFPLVSVASTDPAFYLVSATVFAILELIFIYPMFHHIFDSVDYFADRYDKTAPRTVKIRLFTDIFFILKAALSVLPETVYLATSENNLYDTTVYPHAYMKMGVAAVSVLLTLVIGVVWYICALKFFKRIQKNVTIVSNLKNEIANYREPASILVTSSVKTSFLLLSLAAFSAAAISIDGVTLIPEIVSPVLILFAIHFLKKVTSVSLNAKISAIFSTVCGAAAYTSVAVFANKYHDLANANFDLAKEYFPLPAIIQFIFQISMVVTIVFISKPIKNIIDDHTGIIWESAYRSHNKESVTQKKRQQALLVIITLFGALTVISCGVSYALIYILPVYRVINAGVGLIFAISVTEYLNSVKYSVSEFYSDEVSKFKK